MDELDNEYCPICVALHKLDIVEIGSKNFYKCSYKPCYYIAPIIETKHSFYKLLDRVKSINIKNIYKQQD